jgi:hypothetical protein
LPRNDAIDANDAAEKSENADPTDPIDRNEPAEPIERHEPTDPMESTEPREPMHSRERFDHSDHFAVSGPVRMVVSQPGSSSSLAPPKSKVRPSG